MKKLFLIFVLAFILVFAGCDSEISSGEDILTPPPENVSEPENEDGEEVPSEPTEDDIFDLLMYQIELYERGNHGFPIDRNKELVNEWLFASAYYGDLEAEGKSLSRTELILLIFERWYGVDYNPDYLSDIGIEKLETALTVKECEIEEDSARIVVGRNLKGVELWDCEYVFMREDADEEILNSLAKGLTLGGYYWRYESVTPIDDRTEYEPVVITTAEQLLDICAAVNNQELSAVNGTFVLGNDIDMSGYDWVPMGTRIDEWYSKAYVYAKTPGGFNGEFDGAGYTISGVDTSVQYFSNEIGFFGRIGPYGYVHDLSVSGTVSDMGLGKDSNNFAVGGFAGIVHHGARVENCHFTGEVSGHTGVGGFAGTIGYAAYGSGNDYPHESIVKNCSSNAKITANYECGGFAGTIYNGVSDCEAVGTLDITSEGWRPNIIGGFVGGLMCDLENCKTAVSVNYDVDAPDWMGNFAGELVWKIKLINCTVDTDNLHEGWRLIGMQHYKDCEINITKENWYLGENEEASFESEDENQSVVIKNYD